MSDIKLKSPVTTHVLDTATGLPAKGIHIELSQLGEDGFRLMDKGVTNEDGRIATLLSGQKLAVATYRMHFSLSDYFKQQQVKGFYPYADIVFEVTDSDSHYHIPLLLSPYGYSTYRGS